MIKAIFLDFDGTLYSHATNKIPESCVYALNKLQEKGIKSFICSGRSPYETNWFKDDLKKVKFEGMILNNGQIGIDMKYNKIFDHPIHGELKKRLIKMFNEKQISMYLNTFDDIFINYVSEAAIRTQNAVSSPVPPVKEYEGEDFYMVSMFFKDDEEYKKICDMNKDAFITTWQEGAIDIVSKDVSKSLGIKEMLSHYNISIEEAIGIGDGENDIDMIEKCGIGVAMGNGKDACKKVADYVTTDIDDGGIYNALKYYFPEYL